MRRLMASLILSTTFISLSAFAGTKESTTITNQQSFNERSLSQKELLRRTQLIISYVEQITAGDIPNDPDLESEVRAMISDDFVRETRPNSLQQRDSDWEQLIQQLKRLGDTIYSTFDIAIRRSTITKSRVIVEAQSISDIKLAAGGGQYGQEYILSFEFDRKGNLIKLLEYADSLYSSCFFRLQNCDNITFSSAVKLATSIDINSVTKKSYCANVQVKNISSADIENWRVTVDNKGAKLLDFWGADFVAEGETFLVTPLSSAAPIKVGETIRFDYCAKNRGANGAPTVIASERP